MELYNKYRPQTFEEIRGNDLAVKSIKSELDKGTHVFLLTGSGGCGKTTIARVAAKHLGANDLSIREINSSENRGIDSVREIMEEIRYAPLDGGKLVYILDECFHKDSLIDTLRGRVKIKDVICGEWVYNSDGIAQVKSLQKKKIPLNRCVILTTNYGQLLTTKEHLFYTKDGFVEAENLVEGDVLYDNQDMPNMWEGISDLSVCQWKNLRKCLWYITTQTERVISEAERLVQTNERKKSESFDLSSVWEEFYDSSKRPSEILFDILCSYWTKAYNGSIKDAKLCNLWETIQSAVLSQQKDLFSRLCSCLDKFEFYWKEMPGKGIRDNEDKQSFKKSLSARKNKKYKDEEWNSAYMDWKTWRERSIYERADAVVQAVGGRMVSGISCKDLQKITISDELQSGYRESIFESCNRDRWIDSQYSKSKKIGQEKNRFAGNIRVESIEIYESRDKSKSFSSYFTNTEYNLGFIELYDMEIYGAPTYYVNGVLVHNCHQNTIATQNAMLKVLEECPEYCYFFLATTNPEKLIQPLKTRCSIVNMKPLNHEDMLKLLRIVTRREGAMIDLEILSKVADLSDGSSRQGLKILSSIIGLENDDERRKFLEENQFTDDKAETIELCRALFKQEGWAKYMECLEKLKGELASNAEGIRQAVMGYACAVLKKGRNPVAVAMLQTFSNQDCYKNGKNAIYVAILDFEDYLAG